MIANLADTPYCARLPRSGAHPSTCSNMPVTERPPLRDRRLQLRAGQVDVWALDMACVKEQELHDHLPILDFIELGRLDRLRTAMQCMQFVAGRVLLRRALSRYTQVRPHAWSFDAAATGRPFVAAPAEGAHLFYSLSHSEGLIALAVSLRPQIGIDVEPTARALPLDHLEHLLFSPAGARLAQDPGNRTPREAFIAHRCLQGALLKARGAGFEELLGSFEFDIKGSEATLRCHPELDPSPDSWWLRFLDISEPHTVAVAARDHHAVRIFRSAGFP